MGSSFLTSLLDGLKLDDTPTPELSVLSEVDEIYNGTGTWVIPLSDLTNNNSVASNEFYIGTANYCKFFFQLNYEKKSFINEISINFVSLVLKFVQKLPGGAQLKCDVSFVTQNANVFDSKEFTAGENTAELTFAKRDGSFAVTNDLNRYAMRGNIFLEWTVKMKIGIVNWESDTRKFSLKKRYDFKIPRKFLFEENCFSDVTFRIHGGEVTAHKSILSFVVPTFRVLFNGTPSTLNYFKLKNIDIAPLQEMLKFVYSGDIPKLDFTLASLLYVGGHNYKVGDLKSICSSYLGANLTAKNVFIAMSLAYKCEDVVLKEFCIEFIKRSDTKLLAKNSVHITK